MNYLNMNFKYLVLTAAIMTTFISNAQITKRDTLLQLFNNGIVTHAPEDTLSEWAIKYANIVNRENLYDSFCRQIIAIYPKGFNAAIAELKTLYPKAESGNLTLTELNKVRDNYPSRLFINPEKNVSKYYYALAAIGFPNFIEKDSSAAMSLIYNFDYNLLNNIAWTLANTDKHLAVCEKLSKLSLEKIQAEIGDSAKISQNKRSQELTSLLNNQVAVEDTYAVILSKIGKKREALHYQEKVIQKNKNNIEMNMRYIVLLNENGEYAKALALSSQAYTNNIGGSEMLKQISLAYKKEKNTTSWETYVESLKEKRKATVKANLIKTLIDKPAQDFTLKDISGKTVALSNYKDKVVILDFWATWCGPCKRSFPGMQLALNKYKKNTDVVFLFIDTWENNEPTATKDAIVKFVAEKKYDFHVLLDEKKDSKDFKVATAYQKAYGMDGIPTKFIIGKDGKVKFKIIGYSGSDEKVLDEVSISIDYLLTGS